MSSSFARVIATLNLWDWDFVSSKTLGLKKIRRESKLTNLFCSKTKPKPLSLSSSRNRALERTVETMVIRLSRPW